MKCADCPFKDKYQFPADRLEALVRISEGAARASESNHAGSLQENTAKTIQITVGRCIKCTCEEIGGDSQS